MTVKYKTTDISYTQTGSGPVVLWLHGFMENKSVWKHQTDYLNKQFTNICVDLAGHGATKSLHAVHSMEMQANLVSGLLKQLGINAFAIVGHSMGGYVGLVLLELFKEKVTHFVLLNSTSYADSQEKRENRDRAAQIVASQKESYVRMGIVNLFSSKFRQQNSAEIELLIQDAKKNSASAIVASLMGMRNRQNKTRVLKEFKGKKLIIAGKNDPVIAYQDSVNEAAVTESEFLGLDGGHMSYMEATDQLNINLLKFL